MSLKSPHGLAEGGFAGISGGKAEDCAGVALGGIGGRGFVTRRGGSVCATCPRTSDGCSDGCCAVGRAGDVSGSRR